MGTLSLYFSLLLLVVSCCKNLRTQMWSFNSTELFWWCYAYAPRTASYWNLLLFSILWRKLWKILKILRTTTKHKFNIKIKGSALPENIKKFCANPLLLLDNGVDNPGTDPTCHSLSGLRVLQPISPKIQSAYTRIVNTTVRLLGSSFLFENKYLYCTMQCSTGEHLEQGKWNGTKDE